MQDDQLVQLRLMRDNITTFIEWVDRNDESTNLTSLEFQSLAWGIHCRTLDWVNGGTNGLDGANEAIQQSMENHL